MEPHNLKEAEIITDNSQVEAENKSKKRKAFVKNVANNSDNKISHVYISFKSLSIKNSFLEWSQTVTCHCFPKVFYKKTHLAIKCVWALIFLLFLTTTFFVLVNIVISYFQYNVVSSISVINERPSLFPVVTICNSNPFTTKEAENLIRNLSIDNFEKNLENVGYYEFLSYRNDLNELTKQYVNAPNYEEENKKSLGFNLSQIINSCYFNQEKCNWTNEFHWVFNYEYGNCYQFNSGLSMPNKPVDLKKQVLGGDLYGLSITLGPLINENKIPLTNNKGLKVFIHNQSFQPAIDDNFLSVEAGTETSIAIERIFLFNAPKPYSDCTDLTNGYDSDLFMFIKNSNKTYRQQDCFDLCFQQLINLKCQCLYTRYPVLYNIVSCFNSSQAYCISNLKSDYFRNQLKYVNYCSQKCPLECNQIKYENLLTSLKYPSIEEYIFGVNNQLDFNSTQNYTNLSDFNLNQESFFSLKVFYSTTKYSLITESPQMTIAGLLSSLGGSLGMFLGLSVFSFLELFEIFFKIIFILFFQKS